MVATQILDRIFTFEFGEELVSRIEGRLRVFRIRGSLSRIGILRIISIFQFFYASEHFSQNNSLPLLVVAGNNECVEFAREIRKFVPSPRLFR